MEIRKCDEKDVMEIYELICELENERFDYKSFEEAYKNKIKNEKNYYFLGIKENQIVGFISLVIDYQLHHAGKVATVEELIINDRFRNHGIGKMLLNEAINCARVNNCRIIELTSNFSRERSHKFYEKNGFNKESYKFKMNL